MEVHGPGSVKSVFPVQQPRPPAAARPAAEARPVSPQDAVEISSAGRLLETASRSSEFRAERLAQIKAQIDAGTYDTPEKLEAALERMFDKLGLTDS